MLNKNRLILRNIVEEDSKKSLYWLSLPSDIAYLSPLEMQIIPEGWRSLKKICLIGLYLQYSKGEQVDIFSFDGIEKNKSVVDVWNSYFIYGTRIYYDKREGGINAVSCMFTGLGFVADCLNELINTKIYGENEKTLKLLRLFKDLKIDKLPIYKSWFSSQNMVHEYAENSILKYIPKRSFQYSFDKVFVTELERNDKFIQFESTNGMNEAQKAYNYKRLSRIIVRNNTFINENAASLGINPYHNPFDLDQNEQGLEMLHTGRRGKSAQIIEHSPQSKNLVLEAASSSEKNIDMLEKEAILPAQSMQKEVVSAAAKTIETKSVPQNNFQNKVVVDNTPQVNNGRIVEPNNPIRGESKPSKLDEVEKAGFIKVPQPAQRQEPLVKVPATVDTPKMDSHKGSGGTTTNSSVLQNESKAEIVTSQSESNSVQTTDDELADIIRKAKQNPKIKSFMNIDSWVG